MKLLWIALPILLISCSQIRWKPASLAIERGWSESGKNIVQTEVLYEEKEPWNPLTGTTIKKNYRTKFRIYDLNEPQKIDGDPPIYSYEINSWTLPGSVYFHSETNRLFWIQGSNDEYGSVDRFPAVWSPKGFHSFDPKGFLKEGQTILHFVPSPDGGTAALILGILDANLEIQSPTLVLADVNGQSSSLDSSYSEFVLKEWNETPEYRIRWSEDSSVLFVRVKDAVFKAKEKAKKLEQAKEFPRCFFPPSNFGPVGISPAGSGGDSDRKRDMESPPFKRYKDKPFVRNISQIRDCPSS
ncbi:hypothetical protein EHQ53_09120 [Leptospira langatensis]|uniref:Lipoprotein n=1 Tax=Leptospira langatensis TaxID=2484983 RepID=A0A5F1ZWW2_9LEPT|nr:hypothetical protein [Leptospira langatensis]TGK01222.1 hypothetical protein EHO57_09755 [Leptospira langatensis]TGL42328.1 hypothetical protein EHQ53_09120 [Leptospira langatensis]